MNKALRDLREERGLTLAGLADRLGVEHYQVIGNWEKGIGPHVKWIPRLAACFGLTVEEIRQVISETKRQAKAATAHD